MNNRHDSYDEFLKEGLLLYLQLENSHIPPEDEIDYVFSKKFNKFEAKMIKKLRKPYYNLINTAAKRAAIIIISLIIALSSLFTVGAVREKIVKFFYEIYNSYTTIINKKDTAEIFIEKYYTVPSLPKEYFSIFEDTDELSLFNIWATKNNSQIVFHQNLLKSGNGFDSENADIIETTINNTPCLFIQKDENYIYYWEFDGYGFTLTYPSDLGEEFAQSTIGKLIEVEAEPQLSATSPEN